MTVPHATSAHVGDEPAPAWLDHIIADLARETAEAAFLELTSQASVSRIDGQAALERLVDHVAAIGRQVYARLRIDDTETLTRMQALVWTSFSQRFQELEVQFAYGGCS